MKTVFICALALAACAAPVTDAPAAGKRALELTGGESVVISEEDADAWQSVVFMKNGAKVEVRFAAKDGAFVSARAASGPFDYDIAPADGVLSFSAAIKKARETGEGEVEAWAIEPAERGFHWKIFLRDPQQILWEIVLAGDDGELQGMQQEAAAH